ncbi:MAG: hypothetical protein R3B47_15350 [Bacteroidia bacterium]
MYESSSSFCCIVFIAAINACIEPKPPENPFDDLPRDTTAIIDGPELDPNGIASIHRDVFSVTCANSGCHDGTFEPDFRSIKLSYNTLVYHPIIKNNPAGDYEFRVMPGQPNKSVLWNRLNEDIDGQSGIMPLAGARLGLAGKEERISKARIRSWIEGGAKDMFGNSPGDGDLQPAAKGMVAFCRAAARR